PPHQLPAPRYPDVDLAIAPIHRFWQPRAVGGEAGVEDSFAVEAGDEAEGGGAAADADAAGGEDGGEAVAGYFVDVGERRSCGVGDSV
ncbi:MAG: hypothetical protein Q9167_006769, partial [Letrouitia subvulpina]